MMIAILGRQPKLGLAELESLYGATALQPLNDISVQIAAHQKEIPINRLGGTLKLAKPIARIPSAQWQTISNKLASLLPSHIANMPDGKIKLGISVYGMQVQPNYLLRTGLELKKVCRAAGKNMRLIPNNNSQTLNSAQILHNQLTGQLGLELLIIKTTSNDVVIAQTTSVQDVDDYAQRDFGRPKRDAFVGMLPPKLAQIMINLADIQPNSTLLDPFCGTGVILQEAALMGITTQGTDISPKMIDYSHANMEWLAKTRGTPLPTLQIADATAHAWPKPLQNVVCETYLGQPLSGLPSPQKLEEIINTCNTILKKFLINIRTQLPNESRHCIAVPAWHNKTSFRHLPLLDQLESMGYNRVRFQHARWDELIYHRENQIVARELLVVIAQ